MTAHRDNTLPVLVESFFHQYLQQVRVASPCTVRSYRDTLKLFFAYLSHGRSAADLGIDDLDADHVLDFLRYLEEDRKNRRSTRNARLPALRSFFRHMLHHDPSHAEQFHRVLAIPSKRQRPSVASYLEPAEVRILLAQPDQRTRSGARDHASCCFSTTPAQESARRCPFGGAICP